MATEKAGIRMGAVFLFQSIRRQHSHPIPGPGQGRRPIGRAVTEDICQRGVKPGKINNMRFEGNQNNSVKRKGGTVKNIVHFLKSKAFYVVSGLILQVLILLIFLFYFSSQFILIYYLMVLLSTVIAIVIAGKDQDSSSRLLWIFVILALPVFGGILYLLFGAKKIPKALMIKDRQAYADYKQYAHQNMKTLQATGEDPILDKIDRKSVV